MHISSCTGVGVLATTKLHWLGSGSGLNPELGNTSFTVSTHGSRLLLVDCGFTVPESLFELGIMDRVTDVLITHMHADHIGGLETLGFYNYFTRGKRDENRPNLYLASDLLAHVLWEHGLKAGMGVHHDEKREAVHANLESYFKVRTGTRVSIPGLPGIEFFETPHVTEMENYGVRFDNGVYYSGDTIDLPPADPQLIFQDCSFGQSDGSEVHIAYARLKDELAPEVKAKTHLVHLTDGYQKHDPKEDGFAGYVLPDQIFEV